MGSYVALFVLIPLLGAILMPWASRLHRRAADSLALVASLLQVGLCKTGVVATELLEVECCVVTCVAEQNRLK